MFVAKCKINRYYDMLAIDLISNDIPPLKTTDNVEKAVAWMEDFKVMHLPVLEKINFVGLICESDLLDAEKPTTTLDKLKHSFLKTHVRDNMHVFDVLKVMTQQNITVVGVLDEKDKYLGCISSAKMMRVIAEMSVVSDPGGIIELEVNLNDYSLSEIAKIVEMNNAKILGSFITSHPDSNKIQITFKVNRNELGAILQTFYRYNYNVTASFDNSTYYDDLKDRFDSFMNYLNI
jgi:acetoin utilization protein AcuB